MYHLYNILWEPKLFVVFSEAFEHCIARFTIIGHCICWNRERENFLNIFAISIWKWKKKIKPNWHSALDSLTYAFTMAKRLDGCFKQFVRNHVIGMSSGNMKLAHDTVQQVKHFQCTMNIALETMANILLFLLKFDCIKMMRGLTFISLFSTKSSPRTWLIASSGTLVIVWQVSCTIFNVCLNSSSVTYCCQRYEWNLMHFECELFPIYLFKKQEQQYVHYWHCWLKNSMQPQQMPTNTYYVGRL